MPKLSMVAEAHRGAPTERRLLMSKIFVRHRRMSGRCRPAALCHHRRPRRRSECLHDPRAPGRAGKDRRRNRAEIVYLPQGGVRGRRRPGPGRRRRREGRRVRHTCRVPQAAASWRKFPPRPYTSRRRAVERLRHVVLLTRTRSPASGRPGGADPGRGGRGHGISRSTFSVSSTRHAAR